MPNLMGNGTGGVVAHQYINSNFSFRLLRHEQQFNLIKYLIEIMLIYCVLFIWGCGEIGRTHET